MKPCDGQAKCRKRSLDLPKVFSPRAVPASKHLVKAMRVQRRLVLELIAPIWVIAARLGCRQVIVHSRLALLQNASRQLGGSLSQADKEPDTAGVSEH